MRRVIVSCLIITIISTPLWGDETEIEVLQGKVRGRTGQTEMMISAGQKGLVREGQEPIVAVNEPLVQQAIQMYHWIEEERHSGKSMQDATVFVGALDDDQVVRLAALVESTNDGSEPKSVIQVGPYTAVKDLRIYDFEGHLLDYEERAHSELVATYFIHLPKPIEPGEKIRYITVSPSFKRIFWLTEGPVWSIYWNNEVRSKHKLFLYKIILPKSAILLKTYPEVLLTDEVEGRIALTFRTFSGETTGYSRLAFSFLWPDKDGTSLEDVPPEMRGVQDPQQADLIREANMQMARIIDGQRFADASTPLNAMLSSVSDLFHDLDATVETTLANPTVKNAFSDQLEQVRKLLTQYRDELVHLDLHSCSPGSAEPKPGEKVWIKLKHKGTFKPIVTAEYIYTGDGQWSFHGGDFFTLPSAQKAPQPGVDAKQGRMLTLYAPSAAERARGFVAVQGSGPEPHPRLDRLEVDLGRQERDLVPITLAPLSEPDTVSIQVTGIGAKLCQVLVEKDYQLHPGLQIPLDVNSPTQFWLDVSSGKLDHGSYDLAVRLSSSHGTALEIPGTVTIHDVALPQKRAIRMKPFSWVEQFSGLDIHKPETRRRLEVFLDDMAALRSTVCDWITLYNPNNVLPHVKIRGTDQTLQTAGRAGIISINKLPDLDFSFFDPWIGGSAKRGTTTLEMNVHPTITEHDRAFVKAVLGNSADDSDDTCWKLLMWLYSQFRDYALSRGMTETWAWVDRIHGPDTIPSSVQTARRYQEIGYRTYIANIDDVARNEGWLSQLNAQSDAWYLSYWQMHAFLDLTSQAWEYEKRQETVGTKWGPYDNGGAVSTWCTPKPFFDPDFAQRIEDVAVLVNSKALKRTRDIWGNKDRGIYWYWNGHLYACLPDGGNPNEVNMQVTYTLRQPTQGKAAVQLDEGDQIWHATNGNYSRSYEDARATCWRVCADGTHGYSWWCYWLDNSKNCIVWYDQESERMIHSPAWHGLRDGNEDAAYYHVLQERLEAEADQEGLARLAALTGTSKGAPVRLTEVMDPYSVVYHDIDQTNGYRQFNQAKREVLRMLCAEK